MKLYIAPTIPSFASIFEIVFKYSENKIVQSQKITKGSLNDTKLTTTISQELSPYMSVAMVTDVAGDETVKGTFTGNVDAKDLIDKPGLSILLSLTDDGSGATETTYTLPVTIVNEFARFVTPLQALLTVNVGTA